MLYDSYIYVILGYYSLICNYGLVESFNSIISLFPPQNYHSSSVASSSPSVTATLPSATSILSASINLPSSLKIWLFNFDNDNTMLFIPKNRNRNYKKNNNNMLTTTIAGNSIKNKNLFSKNFIENQNNDITKSFDVNNNADRKNTSYNNNNNNKLLNNKKNSIKREERDVSNFDKDEIGWTNINEEVDMAIPMVLSHLQELGMTHFKLPDMEESISVQPLFITYSAGLWLYNGAVYNIKGIYRNGNAMMTYKNKAFQFRLNLIIEKLQFEYDFLVRVMGVSATGTVVGALENVLISSDFSVDIRNPEIKLNDFKIISFSNIVVQLNHTKIVQELSGVILSPITNLFRDSITTTISDDMREQLAEVILEFSRKDELGLRKFSQQLLSSLIGR